MTPRVGARTEWVQMSGDDTVYTIGCVQGEYMVVSAELFIVPMERHLVGVF